MTIRPEDVRKHLASKQGGAGADEGAVPGASLLSEGEPQARSPAVTAAAAAAARENAILESISASYFGLRRGLAALAFALPILLWLWGGYDHLQGSISAYYHYSSAFADPPYGPYGGGAARNILVGILCACGAALYFYKGYSTRENVALNLAGIAAILIALSPMDWPGTTGADRSFFSWVHTLSAIAFFLGIAFVCLFCSGETLELLTWDEARQRRFKRAYLVIGTLMIVLPLIVVAINYLLPRAGEGYVTFAVEVAAIYVFAAFWVVKSKEIALLERGPGGPAGSTSP